MQTIWILIGVLLTLLVGFALFHKSILRMLHAREARLAMNRFQYDRERLEHAFFQRASRLGKPRGLRWTHCDWQSDVTFARDKQSGLFTAFVGVNISFEAVEGGDMEDVAAVSTVRDAAAVFHFQAGQWGTGGRALFNMNPQDAVDRLQQQFERV